MGGHEGVSRHPDGPGRLRRGRPRGGRNGAAPRLRFDLRRHSSDGFAWGYGGSGPAQLALALAADLLGDDDQALAVYQGLKFKVVGRLSDDGWALSETQLRQAIDQIQAARDRPR